MTLPFLFGIKTISFGGRKESSMKNIKKMNMTTFRFFAFLGGLLMIIAAGTAGFATVENVLYALWLGPAILVARAFTSTLALVALSGLVGYQIGRWRMGRSPIHVWIAFFAVVGLHGAYDLLLVTGAGQVSSPLVARLTVLLMIPALLGLLFMALRLADRASPFRRKEPRATR